MIKKLEEEIRNKFKIKYEDLTDKDFNDFYADIAIQLNQLYYSMDKDLVIKNLKYNNIRMTKIRWVKKILTDTNSSITKEIESAKLHYEKVLSKEMANEKFEAFYGAKNIDEYVIVKTKSLEECPDVINPSTIDKIIMIGEEDHDKILMQLEKMTYLEIKRGAKADKFLDMMTQIALLRS